MSESEKTRDSTETSPRLIEKSHYDSIVNSWSWATIRDLCEIQSGKSDTQTEDETDIPVSRIETIADGTVDMGSVNYLEGERADYEKYRYEYGDLIFSNINSEKHIGKTALFDLESTDLYHGMNLLRIHGISAKSLYLYYVFDSPTQKKIWKRTSQPAVNQCSINQTMLKQSRVPVPPVGEQERIASVLYSVDQHVTKLDKRYETLCEHKQALMQDLLTGEKRVTPDTPVRGKVSRKPAAINEVTGWREIKLGELAELHKGRSPIPKSDNSLFGDDIPWVKIGDFPDETIEIYSTEESVTSKGLEESREIPKDTIIVSIYGSIGQAKISRVRSCSHEGVVGLYNLSDEIVDEYLVYLLNHMELEAFGQGSSQKNLTIGILDKLDMSLPPLWEQERIASILYTVDEMINRTETLREEHEQLKQGLMQDLLTGTVRTPKSLQVSLDVVQRSTVAE